MQECGGRDSRNGYCHSGILDPDALWLHMGTGLHVYCDWPCSGSGGLDGGSCILRVRDEEVTGQADGQISTEREGVQLDIGEYLFTRAQLPVSEHALQGGPQTLGPGLVLDSPQEHS